MELYLCSDTMTKSPFSFSRWLSNYCNLFQLINWRFRSITSHSNQERINVFNNISFRDTMSQHISRKTAENYPSLQILSKALNVKRKKSNIFGLQVCLHEYANCFLRWLIGNFVTLSRKLFERSLNNRQIICLPRRGSTRTGSNTW